MSTVHRRDVLKMMGVLATIGLSGCDGGEYTVDVPQTTATPEVSISTRTATISVAIDQTGEIHAVFPDGTETRGENAYEAAVNELVLTPERTLQEGNDLGIAFEFVGVEELRSTIDSEVQRAVSQQFPGFFIYTGRVDRHPLRPCVNQDVTHIHLTLKRYASTDDRNAWAHFHLGTYRDGGRKCFVLFDNLHPWICMKTCSPTRGELQGLLKVAIATALAAVGITIAAWIIEGAAAVLAIGLFAIVVAL